MTPVEPPICPRNIKLISIDYCCIATAHVGVVAYQTASSTFGQGSGPIFLTNIGCGGSEVSLLSCSNTVFVGSYCTHGRDVGVKCERKYQ